VWAWRRECRLAPFGSFNRRNSSEHRRANRVGFERRPIRVGEYQVQVGVILQPVLAPKLILALPVFVQRRDRRRRQADRARHFGLVHLNSTNCLVCVSDRANHGPAILIQAGLIRTPLQIERN
jgi:hypothetical protein